MKALIPIITFILIGSGFIACNKKINILNNNGTNEAIRTEEEELAFVKNKALSFKQNDQGYWEAEFEHGLEMIYIPAGSFIIGNNKLKEAKPEHMVNLSHYWINKTPVTLGQFRAFVQETGYTTDVEKPGHSGPWVYDFDEKGFITKSGYYWDNAFKDVIAKFPEITIDDKHPVNNVSWNDAIAFSTWFSAKTGLSFSLPTEAEWEYAARGTDGRIYPWGNEEPDGTRANYAEEEFNKYFPGTGQSIVHFGVNDGYAITSPVGSFPKGQSPFGALDMAGNVTEWVFDSDYDYGTNEVSDPIHIKDNGAKMMKAGFWAGSAGREGQKPDELKFGHNIRSDARQGDDPNSADDHLGFRVAISYTLRQ